MKQKPAAREWKVEEATEADYAGIWEIFQQEIKDGDTYSYDENTDYELAMDVWVRHKAHGYDGAHGFVVKDGDIIVGTYSLRHNHYGRGSHVANAGYMVREGYRGQGIGRAMCEHSLKEAKKQGCIAMQFNYVVSTNTTAVEAWKALGFNIIGVSPKSYNHKKLGYVDIYIMHRFLSEAWA
jgi:GNAT superfamily N-acetyltransferase